MSGIYEEDREAAQAASIRFSVLVETDEKPDLWDLMNYTDSDIEAWRAGEWRFVGVMAVADIRIPVGSGHFACYRLTSPGIWGVEDRGTPDCGDYIREVYLEEVEELRRALRLMASALNSETVEDPA